MAISQRKLADSVGVSPRTIRRVKESLGITDAYMTDEQAEMVSEACQPTSELQKEARKKVAKKSAGFKPNVRRIDQQETSSTLDMLQDCKEQYVRNEGLIQRLQYEIDQQEILMNGNGNGTLSALPQLKTLENFQKINISLRNQIFTLETEVGRVAEPSKEDNPFD